VCYENVSPCRLVDGYLMVCYENLPPCAGFHERHAGSTFFFNSWRNFMKIWQTI